MLKTKKTFFFYDYETFGIDPSLDRPAQFAGIRTDMDFNIIDDPVKIYCKIPMDYLPDPESIIINNIIPQKTIKNGLCEAEFAKSINKILTIPHTCTIGFNNFQFDDEFTRNIFYRNFFDPYEWEWKNENSRWDLINIVRSYYIICPKEINWPKDENGYPLFNLNKLTQANNLYDHKSHNALSDVYATINIAKILKNTQPNFFNYLFKLKNKKRILSFIKKINIQPLIYISSIFKSVNNNFGLVVPITWHPINKNILITYDLTKNYQILMNLNEKILFDIDQTNKNKFTNAIKLIYINKSPVLLPFKFFKFFSFNKTNINLEECYKNLHLIYKNFFQLKEKIKKIFFILYKISIQNKKDVDQQLYLNFFNHQDKKIFKKINSNNFKKNNLLFFKFHDKRIKELLFRYRARNFFKTLNKLDKEKWFNHCRYKFNNEYLKRYFDKLSYLNLKHKNNLKKYNILKKIFLYAQNILKSINIDVK